MRIMLFCLRSDISIKHIVSIMTHRKAATANQNLCSNFYLSCVKLLVYAITLSNHSALRTIINYIFDRKRN